MKKYLVLLYQLLLFTILTVATQIGGIIYVCSLFINKRWAANFKFKPMVTFIVLYFFATILIVPFVAPIFGREKIKHTNKIKPTNYMTVLLNRNYVRPQLNLVLKQAEKELRGSALEIHYLDANFPFLDKFPLLPHLSHNDGKKIDISLIYQTKKGEVIARQKSISGYGVFENPQPKEFDQINKCLERGHFQYDFTKYITFGKINKDIIFSKSGTKKLVNALLKNKTLGKLFIEPHLKQRLNLTDYRIRYHGCQAVRHDDHIHVQLE